MLVRLALRAVSEDDYIGVLKYLYDLYRIDNQNLPSPGKVRSRHTTRHQDIFRTPKVGCSLLFRSFSSSPSCEEDPIDSKNSWGISHFY